MSHVGLSVDDWNHHENDWDYDGWDESWWDSPDLQFGQNAGTKHSILCAHGEFRGGNRNHSMRADRVVEEANVGFDALLLGDYHTPMDGVGGYEQAYYAGPTQSISTTGNDFDPGVNLFEFYEDGEIERSREPISA